MIRGNCYICGKSCDDKPYALAMSNKGYAHEDCCQQRDRLAAQGHSLAAQSCPYPTLDRLNPAIISESIPAKLKPPADSAVDVAIIEAIRDTYAAIVKNDDQHMYDIEAWGVRVALSMRAALKAFHEDEKAD